MSLLYALGVWLLLIMAGVLAKPQTWTRRFALAVDIFTASIVWSQYDVTISSRCGLAIREGEGGSTLLRGLGWVLNHIQTNHCEEAIASDRQRAIAALFFLQ